LNLALVTIFLTLKSSLLLSSRPRQCHACQRGGVRFLFAGRFVLWDFPWRAEAIRGSWGNCCWFGIRILVRRSGRDTQRLLIPLDLVGQGIERAVQLGPTRRSITHRSLHGSVLGAALTFSMGSRMDHGSPRRFCPWNSWSQVPLHGQPRSGSVPNRVPWNEAGRAEREGGGASGPVRLRGD
jgi:hypothetical protein